MDMRHMMTPMPRIRPDRLIQADDSVLWVMKGTRKVARRQAAKECHPTEVYRVQQIERDRDIPGTRVGQLGPFRLVVGFDGRLLLGERQAEPDVGIDVAVGNMVDDLANSPSARAIR